jgi:signal peptidase I
MSPEIEPGTHVMMETISYQLGSPQRGDVVVFDPVTMPEFATQQKGLHLKRLVGLPGETLQLSNGVLWVNGAPTQLKNRKGPLVYQPLPFRIQRLKRSDETVKIPEGSYFVLGDNSTNSYDSRMFGFVPRAAIVGRVFYRYWPWQERGAVQ